MNSDMSMEMNNFLEVAGTTWYSKTSNDHFTIKDLMNDGSRWMISTTDGRMLDATIMDRYIQSDVPIHNIPKVDPNMHKVNIGALDETTPIESTQESGSQDRLLEGLAEESFNQAEREFTPIAPQVQTTNYGVIDKALSKVEAPKCIASISWPEYPSRQLELLQDIMDIPAAEIAEYIYSKWFDGKVKGQIIEQIKLDLGVEDEN